MFLFLLTLMSGAEAQAEPDSRAPESKQFDFWLGEWDLTWPGEHQGEIRHGSNKVRRALNGYVLHEQFDGGTAIPLRGISLSTYNQQRQQWEQAWVDNEATYRNFAGGMRNREMVLEREGESSDGSPMRQRMVYKNISADSFDWSWEQSKNNGETWMTIWPIHYSRKKA